MNAVFRAATRERLAVFNRCNAFSIVCFHEHGQPCGSKPAGSEDRAVLDFSRAVRVKLLGKIVTSFLTTALMGNTRRKMRIWKHTELAGSSRAGSRLAETCVHGNAQLRWIKSEMCITKLQIYIKKLMLPGQVLF